ncbi:GNAT family N-acetyltransferase [Acidisoma sp.]|uniref:GNAT family N-acetyltransferase n=1 Tax=Acidisoma sp. TaxID=1872115 RepID=UPI003B008CE2
MKARIVVRRESPEQPEAVRLLTLADEWSASLYPAESRHGLSLASLIEHEVRFYLARSDGLATGCGGYSLLPGRAAEMKRVFGTASARGQGIGRAIVEAAEAGATAEHVARIYLETGVKSDEAVRLYRRLGYAECKPFGAYGSDPLSVFMVKSLSSR